ncbi:MAG: sugar transferase [Micrococcales bacterium]|nr:sugar transferase [Micrococcales bacterium]
MTTVDPLRDAGAAFLNENRLAFATAPVRPRESRTATRRALDRYTELVRLLDTLVVLGACVLAMLIRFGVPDPAVPGAEQRISLWAGAAIIAAVWLAALAINRTRDVRVMATDSFEYRRVISATAMVFGVAAIFMFAFDIRFTRTFFVIALPVGLFGLLLSRRLFRSWIAAQRRRGRMAMSTVVVGPETDVRQVLSQLGPSTASAYRVVAAVLDEAPSRVIRIGGETLPVSDQIDDIASTVVLHDADAVIVAGQPRGGGDFIKRLSWSLEKTNADLMIASRLADVAGPRIQFRPAEGLPLMHVELPIYEGGKHLVKRLLDIVVAGGALVALWPLLALIGILVRIDSNGRALFSQIRVGRGGTQFRMWKFRSMVIDAEDRLTELGEHSDGNGVLFKMRNDPRVTGVGRVLRRFSLDELPQLWNVFIGEMSLVGPRPPLITEVESYEDHVLRRLYLKPGLTGMWQVSGRSDLSWEESVRLDLFYVENWSITGDLRIIWRTAKVVLRPLGAY